MIVCPKCGKELADGTKFCSKCGEAIKAAPAPEQPAAETVTCPKCGKQVKAGMKFCVSCGTPLSEAPKQEALKQEAPKQEEPKQEAPKQEAPKQEAPKQEAPKQEAPKQEAPKQEAPKQEAPKQEAPKQEAPKQEAPKQEETKKDESKKDDEKKGGIFANKTVKYVCIALAAIVVLILFGSLLSSGGSSGKHYAMYIKDKEIMYTNFNPKNNWQVSSKLIKEGSVENSALANSSSVLQCTLSEDGKYLFFPDKLSTGDDGIALYYRPTGNQKKEPEKIDSSVDRYSVNKAASLITYNKTSDDLYQYNLKKGEKEKISSEVEEYNVSEDGSKVVYRKESGELYLWTKKGSEKLDSDIRRINYVTKDFKTVYYTKDGALYKKEGTKDKEKVSSDIDRVVKVYDSGEVYYTKEDSGSSTLYYYDGKGSEKITDTYISSYATSADAAVLAFSAKDSDDTGNVIFYVAVKKETTELEQNDATRFLIDPKGKFLYFVADLNGDKDAGDLYKATISGTKVNKPERYNSDVATSGGYGLTEDGMVVYFKDYSKNKGDLYCDQKKIDTDVYGYLVDYCKATKDLVYFVDYDSDKRTGTLKICDAKSAKPKKIADDATQAVTVPNGNVLYLYDYSTKSYKGELYLYKGSKPLKLDDEVTTILQVN